MQIRAEARILIKDKDGTPENRLRAIKIRDIRMVNKQTINCHVASVCQVFLSKFKNFMFSN